MPAPAAAPVARNGSSGPENQLITARTSWPCAGAVKYADADAGAGAFEGAVVGAGAVTGAGAGAVPASQATRVQPGGGLLQVSPGGPIYLDRPGSREDV